MILRSLATRRTLLVPVLAVVLLILTWGRDLPGAIVGLVTLVLAGAVLAAVHHAEVIARRVSSAWARRTCCCSPSPWWSAR